MPDDVSGTDVAAATALLWRTPDDAARPGRRGLGVGRIVEAAVAVADAEGLTALSMRRVAAELGVGAMSLYTHVPGRGVLLALMHDAVLAGMYADPPTGHWRARLTAVARTNRDLYLRHPWAARAESARPVLGPHAVAKHDTELAAVDGLGLGEAEMDLLVDLVTGFVRGTVGRLRDDGASGDEQEATRPGVLDPQRYPTAARVGTVVGRGLASPDPQRAFEFGLERLLDGIGVLILNPSR